MKRGLVTRLERSARLPREAREGREASGDTGRQGVTRRMQERIVSEYADLLLAARRDTSMRSTLTNVISKLLVDEGVAFQRITREALASEITSEIVGYGPIDPPLNDPEVQEVMVNGPHQVFVERAGRVERTGISFRDEEHVMEVVARMVAPLGRRVDRSQPFVDARLPDGSRVHAIIPPAAVNGPILTIRKFAGRRHGIDELVQRGTLSQEGRGV